MDAVRLSRLTTAAAVAVAGMAAGHVLMPYAPRAAAWKPAAFWALVLAVGAFRGWRDGVVREERGRTLRWRVAVVALAGAALALVAYVVVHGTPAAQ